MKENERREKRVRSGLRRCGAFVGCVGECLSLMDVEVKPAVALTTPVQIFPTTEKYLSLLVLQDHHSHHSKTSKRHSR